MPARLSYPPTPNFAGLIARDKDAADVSLDRILAVLDDGAGFGAWAQANVSVLRWLSNQQAGLQAAADAVEQESARRDEHALVWQLYAHLARVAPALDLPRIRGWASTHQAALLRVARYLVQRGPRIWTPRTETRTGTYHVTIGMRPAWLEHLERSERLRLGLTEYTLTEYRVRNLSDATRLVEEFLVAEAPQPENLPTEFGRVRRGRQPHAVVDAQKRVWAVDTKWTPLHVWRN